MRRIIFIAFLAYFPMLFLLAYFLDRGHPGGEQVFLTVIAKGILFFFLIFCLIASIAFVNNLVKKKKKEDDTF